MAVESIAKTLGAGSGIDIKALVDGLVEAQFAAKKEALTKREEKLEAQISGVSKLKQTITDFDQALKSLVRGGTLSSKLTSSNEASLKVSALPNSPPSDVSTRVGVTSIASAQVSTTNTPLTPDTQFRRGTLAIRLGSDIVDAGGNTTGFTTARTVNVTIDAADTTLAGIAAKINASGAGLTAKVITDGAGERLSIAGAMGANQAFEITATNAGGGGGGARSLTDLNVGGGATTTTTGTRARDAVVTVDGVQYRRQTNTIDDLVPGSRLELIAPSTTPVALGMTRPGVALTEAVNNFVGAYNEMMALVKAENDPFTGALRADSAVEALQRNLKRLTTTPMAPAGAAGAPRTLAELGVLTARDGTLSVDNAKLSKMMAAFPIEVEKLFAETTGLPAALGTVARQVADRRVGLDASGATYRNDKTDLADDRLDLADAEASLRERLTRQFASMEARTSAYKATQAFMDNQIKAWNRSDA